MTPNPMLGALLGAVIAAGLFTILIGARGDVPSSAERPTIPRTKQRPLTINTRALAASVIAGGLASAVTGWWAILLLATVAGVVLPSMQRERAGQLDSRKRVAAVASWVSSILALSKSPRKRVMGSSRGAIRAVIRAQYLAAGGFNP